MNRYPLWKYLLILSLAAVGFIYALANLFPADPAIQISGSSAALKINERAMAKATSSLDRAGIRYFGEEHTDANGLIRLYSLDDQSRARSVVKTALGNDYVVAVNLAETTPDWLLKLGAGPMKLGLDLAGGVHFLLEVDTPKVIAEELKSLELGLLKAMREARIFGVAMRRVDNEIVITADTDELRTQMTGILRKDFPELEYKREQAEGKYIARAKMTTSYIKEKEDYAVSQNLTTLRNRVNEIGVSEPLVQRQGRNRIVVQLPGIQDTARAKSIIGKTANLEFRLEATNNSLPSRKERFDFRNEMEQRRFGGAFLEKNPILKGDSVTNAQVGYDADTGQPQVNISLDSQGGIRMNSKTKNNVGRRMGVLFIEFKTEVLTRVDEKGNEVRSFTQSPESSIISLATVQSALGRSFRITGLDNTQEASELALLLRAGALAAPMGFVEERTIGPSLGKENIELGVKSVQVGLVLVLIFMLVYYRLFGLLANIALALNLVLLVAIMSLFGATLTLPGIAGIVLTVGMAVDANVLIFSRIREELKSGSAPQKAIDAGFGRAFETILDANITTFIVAIILYAIGSGPVKGFAVTLAIGIVTSMFTAIMGTRALVNAIHGGRRLEKLWI